MTPAICQTYVAASRNFIEVQREQILLALTHRILIDPVRFMID